jgi:RNA polymerase sigma factor (sigma-70 family)
MTGDVPFAELLDRLRRRDNAAAAAVVERFARRLAGLARRRLVARVQTKLDPEDIVQSVFGILFDRVATGKLQPDDWDGLGRLLACMTRRRCSKWNAHFRAQGFNVDCEVTPTDWHVPAKGPTPSAVALRQETAEALVRGLRESHRLIVLLSLEGTAVPEISRLAGCSERTVYRVLRRVQKRLQQRAG